MLSVLLLLSLVSLITSFQLKINKLNIQTINMRLRLNMKYNDDAVVASQVQSRYGTQVSGEEKDIVIEIVAKKRTEINDKQIDIVGGAYNTVYRERKEEVVEKVLDSPISAVFGILFNPTTMVLALYFSSIAWTKVKWINNLLKMFGVKGNVNEDKNAVKGTKPADDLPFQIFECSKCQMEMRPAKGRAEVIFGRERFRCSRCGAKASAYFNVDDLTDPRAIERLERIAKEKEEEDDLRGTGDDDEDEEIEEEEEEEKPAPKRRK